MNRPRKVELKDGDCPKCNGGGRAVVEVMGELVELFYCEYCEGTGRVKEDTNDVR